MSRCARPRSPSSTSRRPVARRGTDAHHRDRRGQGLRRRGPRRVPDARASRAVDRCRTSACSPASPTRWWSTPPPIAAVIPSFLEFARGSVLVAHNAPFDVGFLRAACAVHGHAWPAFPVVDTAVLARRVLTPRRGAQLQAGDARPALPGPDRADPPRPGRRPGDGRRPARADRAGRVARRRSRCPSCAHSPRRSATRSGASGIWPTRCRPRPGVYIFRDAQGNPLYVGTSRNLRARVRQYFLASETRSRMGEMIGAGRSGRSRSSARTRSRRRCASCG